jgi:hypothetical protein
VLLDAELYRVRDRVRAVTNRAQVAIDALQHGDGAVPGFLAKLLFFPDCSQGGDTDALRSRLLIRAAHDRTLGKADFSTFSRERESLSLHHCSDLQRINVVRFIRLDIAAADEVGVPAFRIIIPHNGEAHYLLGNLFS